MGLILSHPVILSKLVFILVCVYLRLLLCSASSQVYRELMYCESKNAGRWRSI
jgi:hypothetical protein